MVRKKDNTQRQAMNMMKLMDRYHSEDKCLEVLEDLRWPDGVRCPRCESDKISRIVKRDQFDCDSCRYQFSVKAGTIFHDSHLPLRKWFVATYLMCESRKGISANQIKRTIGVSYKTAWYLCHRIRAAMKEVMPERLEGIIEVDETYVGGKRKGGPPGRSTAKKKIVVGAIERGGEVRLRVVDRATAKNLHGFIDDVTTEGFKEINTDDFTSYQGLTDEDTSHKVVNHQTQWVRSDGVHTQTVESVWSLLKRSIVGSYHQLSAKHLPAYLDEFSFRFNNRNNPYLFRDTLTKLVGADNLPYAELVTDAN